MLTLQKMCINTIIDKDINTTNFYLPNHLVYEIDLTKHQMISKPIMEYLNKINAKLLHTPDRSLYHIQYLQAHEFFSYDHLLIRYRVGTIITFAFIPV